eukprot:CAMPEP_0175167524 /NCGR_PEP_ID=MMETSP0087-20121206/28398_1 /TAXON_ID=136419 /ORGANISM="Unknown Unknown, Strain D1" /LENGTH=413 /DNA_ID=CAMNT_0016457439 /DNA_START=323 /DNA_END=1560 /DNA_ORIENTATION=+
MTTIGYGDITPTNNVETIFIVVAEIAGLSVFALLLTNINLFNDEIVGESFRTFATKKNKLLYFLANHSHISPDLKRRALQDLKYQQYLEETFSVNSLGLSDAVKKQLQIATTGRELKEIPIFGHSTQTHQLKISMRKAFESYDHNNNGILDEQECSYMLAELGIPKSKRQQAFRDIDISKTGFIDFTDFYQWFFMYKHGRPILRWPTEVMNALAWKLQPSIYSQGEIIVGKGEYGAYLHVIKDFGRVQYAGGKFQASFEYREQELEAASKALTSVKKLKRNGTTSNLFQDGFRESIGCAEKPDDDKTEVDANSKCPLIGLAALVHVSTLRDADGNAETEGNTKVNFRDFVVEAVAATFTMSCSREDAQNLMDTYWPDGYSHVQRLVALRYGIPELMDANYVPQQQRLVQKEHA